MEQTLETTCAKCESLMANTSLSGFVIFFCGKTNGVVPHTSEREGQNTIKTEFHRIPLECPRDSGVVKSASKKGKDFKITNL